MKERLVSIKELAEITSIEETSLRLYLDHFTLSKYVTRTQIKRQNNRYKLAVKLNKRFAYKFCDFLRMKRKFQAIENLTDYFEEIENEGKVITEKSNKENEDVR